MADEDDRKPGRSGAARPPVIEAKATPVRKNAKDAKSTKASRSAKEGESEEGAGGKDGDKTPRREEKGGARKAPSENMAGKEHAASGRRGLKVLGGVLLLAAAAGGGAWLYQQYGPQQQLAALREEVRQLRAELAALKSAAEDRAPRRSLDELRASLRRLRAAQARAEEQMREIAQGKSGALAQRLAALQERATANANELETLREMVRARTDTLQERLTALQQAVDAVGRAVGGEGGQGAASAALALPVEALRAEVQALREKLAALAQSVDPAAVRRQLAASMGDQQQQLEALREQTQQRIAALQRQLEEAERKAARALALAEDIKANPPRPASLVPEAARAYAALRRKVRAGLPFTEELDTLAALLPRAEGLDRLAPLAAAGVPTIDTLRQRLNDLIAAHATRSARARDDNARGDARDDTGDETRVSDEGKAGGGLLDALRQRLRQVVKVRRAGEVDWAAVLRRAQAALRETGLPAAMTEIERTEGARAMPAGIREWLAAARARLAADAALERLADTLATHLQRRKQQPERR